MDSMKAQCPVTIEVGPTDWQVLQQDDNGGATVKLAGAWCTEQKRKQPEVRVCVVQEEAFVPVARRFEWARARTTVDRTVRGDAAGTCGRWSVTLRDIPAGGPYRILTQVGSANEAIEWRRAGACVHFLCVGDIWLIAGQSNAEGYGRDPVVDPPEIGVHHCTPAGWNIATHGLRHTAWLTCAKTLKRGLGYPIGLIPTAVGGTAISLWDPGQKGHLFDAMQRRIKQAGGRIRGCIWYQGESDTGAADHPHYKARFTRFAKGLRRVARQQDLPIITVQLNRVLGARHDGAGWEAIRESQRQLSHEVDHIFIVSIFEAGLCDGIHISSQGNLLLGRRIATTALGAVYGQDRAFRHPECKKIRRVSDRRLELQLDHVGGRLDYVCAPPAPFAFAVRDADGEVPVTSFRIRGRNVLCLVLGRRLSGPATVIGAPGCCPPQNVPRDISGYRGMLAFTMDVP